MYFGCYEFLAKLSTLNEALTNKINKKSWKIKQYGERLMDKVIYFCKIFSILY